MNKSIDITGQTFGELTAIKFLYSKDKKQWWLFKCSCGKEVEKRKSDVRNGKTSSCGCKTQLWNSQKKRKIEEIGTIYSYLKIKECITKDDELGDRFYLCDCLLCGGETIVKGIDLRSGNTKSCGCLHSFKEREIKDILLKNNILFDTEYIFKDLLSSKGSFPRFDFVIFKNNKIAFLIEYNGIQHYREMAHDNFGKFQREETDILKQEYCKKKNIPLLILNKDSNLEKEILKMYEVI